MRETLSERPVLYSFRRCPYAMRARMALATAGQRVALREVVLRDKPAEMLDASPKGTVPVLVIGNGTVLEESLDIALWALGRSDPQDLLPADPKRREEMLAFIAWMDGPFKHHLDRTKYATRYAGAEEDSEAFAAHHRSEALSLLADLAERLERSANLFGDAPSLADIATFPFVRQFANTDAAWWQEHAPIRVRAWLARWVESPLFVSVMEKYQPWAQNGLDVPFPRADPALPGALPG